MIIYSANILPISNQKLNRKKCNNISIHNSNSFFSYCNKTSKYVFDKFIFFENIYLDHTFLLLFECICEQSPLHPRITIAVMFKGFPKRKLAPHIPLQSLGAPVDSLGNTTHHCHHNLLGGDEKPLCIALRCITLVKIHTLPALSHANVALI